MQRKMNKAEVVERYTMEELIPIVGSLTEQFTSHESSSVTYERAGQFMEAVIYCIAHCDCETENGLMVSKPRAEEAYRTGYEAVISKVKRTQEKYNRLLTFFDDYGNRNYRDTVEKALPGFFMYYDAKYAPMETMITMDYPVFGLDMNMEGIDMIAQYIDAIWKEQQYLNKFPRDYVLDELRLFHPKYENEFFNIKEILELQLSSDIETS